MSGLPVVRSVPRWDVVRRGGIAAVAGVAALVVAGILFGGRDVAALAAPDARGTIPGAVRFDAEARRYTILLDRLSLTGPPSATAVAATICTVGRADRTVVRVAGARQGVSTESGTARSIGSFTARHGTTTVACAYAATPNRAKARFVVARRSSRLSVAIAVLAGLGLLLGGAGAAMIAWGFRHPVVHRDPGAPV